MRLNAVAAAIADGKEKPQAFAGIAPFWTANPVITSLAIVGSPVTFTDGTVGGTPVITVTSEWLIDDVANGSTGTTYTPVVGDVGKVVKIRRRATSIYAPAGVTATSAGVTVQAAGSSPITPSVVASGTNGAASSSSISGYAPLGVHFDCSGVTSTTTADNNLSGQGGTYRQVKTSANYGDVDASNHSISGLPKNTDRASSHMFAHVYETPGTYTATFIQTGSAGISATTTVSITVLDPSALVTYYISRTGNFVGAPADNGTTILRRTMTTLPVWADSTAYFFCRGENWSSTDLFINSPRQHIRIGAYGSGANPLFSSMHISASAFPPSLPFANDIVISGLTTNTGVSSEFTNQLMLFNCIALRPISSSGADYFHRNPAGSPVDVSNFTNSILVFWVNCVLVGDGNTSGPFSSTDTNYAFFGNGSRLTFLNTRIGRTYDTPVRITGTERFCMRHCWIQAPIGADLLTLKMYGGGPNTYVDNWVASGGTNTHTDDSVNWVGNKWSICDCIFGGADPGVTQYNTAWQVGLMPQNNGDNGNGVPPQNEPLQDVIIEWCSWIRHPSFNPTSGAADLLMSGRRMTSRNNSIQGGGTLVVNTPGFAAATGYEGPYFFN